MFLHPSVSHSVHGGGGQCLGRYTPGTGYTPWDQVHPQDQVHPPGTRYTPWNQVHPPRTRYTPRDQVPPQDQVHPPGTRYTPQDQVHPPGPGTPLRDQVHPPRCREIRATSGRYASYWNAFLFRYTCLQVITDCACMFSSISCDQEYFIVEHYSIHIMT